MATKVDETVQKILLRFKQLKSDKSVWETVYQQVGEYIRIRKQNFTSEDNKGEFVTEKIFDTTAVFANRAMASALNGALFPNGERTIELVPPKSIAGDEVVKEFYEWQTKKLAEYMGLRGAGLALSLDEYLLDAGAFGWGGVTLHDDKEDFETPIKFSNWDPKYTYIDENTFGFVDTVYYAKSMLVFDAAKEYGLENLSDKAKEAVAKGKVDAKIKVLVALQPREFIEPGKMGNKNMQIASYHIDLGQKILLKESGFDYMPATMARFSKNAGEVYGRGPGIDSFPDVMMANAQNEAIIRAAEKQLDPPLGVLDDGTLGTEVVNTSAGGISVISFQGRIPNSNPIFPLFTVGEFRSMQETLKETRERISQHFLLDRLLDFNNDVRMTLGEVQIRERIRGESLSSVFNRQISEMYDPLIKKSFNALFARGFLGVTSDDDGRALQKKLEAKGVEIKVIPEAVLDLMNKGADVYDLKYISPAARIMDKERVTSAFTLIDAMVQAQVLAPEIGDYLNEKAFMDTINEGTGGESKMLNADNVIKNTRAARAEQAAKEAEAENAVKMAMAARDGSQAAKTMEEAT